MKKNSLFYENVKGALSQCWGCLKELREPTHKEILSAAELKTKASPQYCEECNPYKEES